MKRIAYFTSIAILLCMLLPIRPAAKANEDVFLVAYLTENNKLFSPKEDDYTTNASDKTNTKNSLNILISNDKNTVLIEAFVNEVSYKATLPGTIEVVKKGTEIVGYVGVYDGYFISADGSAMPIIVDAVFTENEVFAILTQGIYSEHSDPSIRLFGEMTEELKRVNSIYRETIEENENSNHFAVMSQTGGLFTNLRTDYIIRHQGSDTSNAGDYEVGTLSFFHANEMENGGNLVTYAKVNSNSTNFLNYLRNDLGYNTYTFNATNAFPDSFDITIKGKNQYFQFITNAFLPQEVTTTQQLTVPYIYGGSVSTISFNIIASSIDVTLSSYSSVNSNKNIINWSIYNRNGFGTDGNASSRNGMVGEVTYTYAGNITSNVTRYLEAVGRIRYQYWVDTLDGTITAHMWSGQMKVNSDVTVKP